MDKIVKDLVTQRLRLKDIYPEKADSLAREYNLKADEVELIRKGVIAEKSEVDKDERAIINYISTDVKDRDNEILEHNGVILSDYRKNPIVPWAHDYRGLPIGKNIWIKKDKKGLIAKTVFLKHQFADEVYQLYTEDVAGTGPAMKAWSVGFIPLEWEGDIDEDEPKRGERDTRLKRRYKKWLLLEYSAVPVPSNPEALTLMIEKGLIKSTKLKDMLADIIHKPEETETTIRIPVRKCDVTATITISEKEGIKALYCGKIKKVRTYIFDKKKGWTLERAKKWVAEHDSGKSIKLIGEDEMIKGVIPYRDTGKAPEDTPWDGPKEVREAKVSDLKIMCAWVDPEHTDIKGGYKLPHHQAKGHKVVWRGVANSMAVLFGARGGVDVPGGDRRGIYNHLSKHYKQFDKTPPEFREYTTEELKEMFPEVYAEQRLAEVHNNILLERIDELANEVKALKEGRVLSEKNRKLVKQCADMLIELYNATEPEPKEGVGLENIDMRELKKEEIDIDPEELTKVIKGAITEIIEKIKPEPINYKKIAQEMIDKAKGKVG